LQKAQEFVYETPLPGQATPPESDAQPEGEVHF
jgi:hypothetical protein